MGKKKHAKITRITDEYSRKITLCKRKKGLIKKCIELSVLCDVKLFLMIQDDKKKRVTHFTSHKDLDPLRMFNDLY